MIGRAKAPVFPDPVWPSPTKSLPAHTNPPNLNQHRRQYGGCAERMVESTSYIPWSAQGMASDWILVGCRHPMASHDSNSSRQMPSSANVLDGCAAGGGAEGAGLTWTMMIGSFPFGAG
jgi:hypothetical protein